MARNIRVTLDLDTGNFNVQVRNATGRFIDLDQAIRRAGGSLGATERQARNTLGTLRDLTVITGQARNAFLNLRDAVFGWVGPIIAANREIERASFLLQGMSTSLTQVGRRTEAADNIRELLDLAKSSPFSLGALTDSFVKMKAGGIDPMDGSMKSLVDAVATFGGDSQILNRASIAIQQMAGKGVISMEELRQQLGEAVPTAINLMARSLGVSYQELVDRISKGQVRASGALKAMFAEFDRTFGGASSRLVNSFGGSLQRAQTTLTEFALTIGGFSNGTYSTGSFMAELTASVNEFTDALGSNEAAQFAQIVGDSLASVVRILRDMVRWLVQNIDLITAIGRGLLLAFTGRLLMTGLASIISMFTGMGRSARALGAEITRMQRGFAIATTQINRAATTGNLAAINFNRMAVAARTIGRAMLNMVPLVGQAILVITTIADALGLFRDRAKEARSAFDDFKKGIVTQEGLEAARNGIDDLERKIEIIRKVSAGELDRSSLPFGFPNYKENGPADGGITGYESGKLADLETELELRKAEWQRAVNVFASDLGTAVGNNIVRNFEVARAEFNSAFDQLARDFQSQRDAIEASETLTDKQKAERLEAVRQEELANVRKYYENLIAAAEGEYKKQAEFFAKREALDAKAGVNDRGIQIAEQNRKGNAAALKVLGDYVSALKEKRDAAYEILNAPSPFIDGNGDGTESKISAAQRKIIQLTGDIAKLNGGYNTVTAAVDEFNAELEEGAYPGITEAEKERIRALIKEKEQLDITRQAQDSLNDVLDEATKAHEDATVAMESMWGGGVERSAQAVENFRQKLFAMTEKMREATGETKEWAAAVAAIPGAVSSFSISRQAQVLDGIRASNEEARMALMSLSERRQYEFERESARVFRLIDLEAFSGEERKRVEAMVYSYLNRLRDEQENYVLLSIQRQLQGWTELNQNIADGVTGWLDQMIDALVTGEFSFGKFAKAVLADIAKIIMRATIANAIMAALGGGRPSTLSQTDMDASIFTPSFHTGGTVGLNTTNKRVSPGLFANAPRYHTGGIAGLKPGEVPAILKRGERVSTEQQWRAMMDSKAAPMAGPVQVNLINQSGTPLDSSNAGARFDGENMILDVVIKAMHRPGKMRDAVRGVK